MNGESVANHVTVNALVLAPVLVDLRAVRSALETILNLNHATNHVNCVKILIFVLTLRFSKILKISVLFDFQESAFCYHCFLKASGNYGKDFLVFWSWSGPLWKVLVRGSLEDILVPLHFY